MEERLQVQILVFRASVDRPELQHSKPGISRTREWRRHEGFDSGLNEEQK